MADETVIKKVDDKYLAIVTTTTSERLIAKVTLEAQKAAKLKEIADIDAMLLEFEPK